jgi:hypothetical protein
MEDFISRIEQAIHHLPMETAEEIQQETSQIIRLAKPQRNNTTKAEREALLTLRNDDSIRFSLQIKIMQSSYYSRAR